MKWSALRDYAAKCLSSQQLASLDHQRALYDRVSLLDLFRNKTVQEVLNDDQSWASTEKQATEIIDLARNSGAPPASPTSPSEIPQSKTGGPWVLPFAVQFIFRDHSEGSSDPADIRPEATSFIVGIPSEGAATSLFLVSARHVIEPSWANCSNATNQNDPNAVIVRLNKRAGGTDFLRIGLRSPAGAKLYFVPDDQAIDVAVVPLRSSDLTQYSVLAVPLKQIATDAEMASIDVGAPLLTAGLQPDLAGSASNTPISKNGTLSDKRSEPIEVPCQDPLYRRKIHVWIVQGPFTAGLSGAPVFSVISRGAGHTPILVGIQSAEWPDESLSGITPSSYLVKLLMQAVHNSGVSPP